MKKVISPLIKTIIFAFVFMTTNSASTADWKLPPDKGTMSKDEVSAILAGNDYPETTTYTRKIEFIDFTSYGQKFTQVVVTLHPKQTRMHKGKKLVVVGGEPGSEYAMDFLETPEGKEGMGVWLAKRGFTFIALTRVGRWNFFDGDVQGRTSVPHRDVPMPRAQDAQERPAGGTTPGMDDSRDGGGRTVPGATVEEVDRVGNERSRMPGAASGNGSWKDIPLEQRMPIFNRDQKSYWSPDDYTTQKSSTTIAATGGDSAVYRIPKPGTELYNQILAAASPVTLLKGYQLAIEHVLPPKQRSRSFLLYWGMSTGGAFLYPLAKHVKPDGYLGWGTSSTGLAYIYRKATQGDFNTPYTKSALRVRERGLDDFDYYTRDVPADVKERWWQGALKEPRFKSIEDAPMQFNSAALTEIATRLWMADFLPAEYKKAGLAKFIQDIMEPSFPPKELKSVAILDMNGTLDEAIPPKTVDAHREVMEPYAAKYRVARIQDFHHYLFTQDSIKVVGSVWLRFIESGYFDSKNKNVASVTR